MYMFWLYGEVIEFVCFFSFYSVFFLFELLIFFYGKEWFERMMNNIMIYVILVCMIYFGVELILQLIVISFIVLVGVMGNIFICVILMSKYEFFKLFIKQYLISLVVVDIGIFIIVYFMIIIRSEISWLFGEYVC